MKNLKSIKRLLFRFSSSNSTNILLFIGMIIIMIIDSSAAGFKIIAIILGINAVSMSIKMVTVRNVACKIKNTLETDVDSLKNKKESE